MTQAGGQPIWSEGPCGFRRRLVVDLRADCYKDIAGFLLKLAISRRTCGIEENLRYREKLAKGV
eukprot:scaffold20375_cov85-Phaeocystis_antarctica.AAC.1